MKKFYLLSLVLSSLLGILNCDASTLVTQTLELQNNSEDTYISPATLNTGWGVKPPFPSVFGPGDDKTITLNGNPTSSGLNCTWVPYVGKNTVKTEPIQIWLCMDTTGFRPPTCNNNCSVQTVSNQNNIIYLIKFTQPNKG